MGSTRIFFLKKPRGGCGPDVWNFEDRVGRSREKEDEDSRKLEEELERIEGEMEEDEEEETREEEDENADDVLRIDEGNGEIFVYDGEDDAETLDDPLLPRLEDRASPEPIELLQEFKLIKNLTPNSTTSPKPSSKTKILTLTPKLPMSKRSALLIRNRKGIIQAERRLALDHMVLTLPGLVTVERISYINRCERFSCPSRMPKGP